MIVLHEMRRRARFLVGPLLGAALTSYFAYHTIEGDRGLRAWRGINEQLHAATDALATVQAERDALAHKVAGLNPNHVDPDLLDAFMAQPSMAPFVSHAARAASTDR